MKHCHQHRVAGRGAKALVALVAFIALVGAMLFAQPDQASAQNARIKHVITKQTKQSPQMGRELWFTMIQNYMDQSGKYYQLYVTSPAQTNVYVNMAGQATKVLPVQPLTVASFSIPLGWEIKSSAVVTNNAIHVWSNDGDICAYLMSHNPYTSDGMYIIPKIGWGTTYVVAAYNALFEGFGSYVYDFPSEMAIVADVDNTVVTITPSTDIRVEGSPQACCSCLIHPKGVPFVEILNRGQAIQYQTTCTQNAEDFDFSGTIVTSNVPVGVVAGSTCPNIPMENPYCDHVCDMMAPVRTWAQTYYSAPFYPAAPGKQWSSFMVISSKAHQTIYRMDPNTPAGTPFCTIDAQYGTYLRPDIDQPSRWYSDAPFYLIQYINSATYPDGINGNGDPAEVIINPVEQYTKTVVFQTPTSIGNQSPYLNYVNIISLKNSTKNTTFDGQKISGLPHMAIDGVYEITRVKGVKSGAHIIQSDTGVGVYIYGYGYNESYAWTGSYGTGTFHSPDTIAPEAIPTGSCFYAHVALTDSGLSQSKLNEIRIDSVYNMAYNQDDPKWIEGVGIPSSYYDMFVLDSTKEAYLKISVFDVAGNLTTIVSTYVPQTARIAPPIRDFGVGNIGGAPVYQYDTIVNTGSVPFVFTDLKLALGQGISGFALDSAVTTPLGVGETRIFKLSFVPQKPTASYDTIIFGDPCIRQEVLVVGTGGGADFQLTNYDYGTVVIGDPTNSAKVSATSPAPVALAVPSTHVKNLSKSVSVTIDSIWCDSAQFVYLGTVPFTLGPGADTALPVKFTPTYTGQIKSLWHGMSNTLDKQGNAIGVRNATLTANASMPMQQFYRDTTIVVTCATPGTVVHFVDTVIAKGSSMTIVNHASHSATDTNWSNFGTYYQRGRVNPDTALVHLENGGAMEVREDFTVPENVNGSWTDIFTVTTTNGDTMRVRATVQAIYLGGETSTQNVTFAKVPYLSAPITQTFTITDTTAAQLRIDSLSLGGVYQSSFTLSTVPALPAVLDPKQTMTVTVTFKPDQSFDPVQTAIINIASNACNPLSVVNAQAAVSVKGAASTGYTPAPILACRTQTNTLNFLNLVPKDKNSGAVVLDTVVSVVLSGIDAANFTLDTTSGTVGQLIAGPNGKLAVPVTFTPTSAARKTYYFTVTTILHNDRNAPDTLVQMDSAIAEGVAISVASNFAVAQQTNPAQGDGKTTIALPINLSSIGLVDSLSSLGVNNIRLVYTFDADLLDLQGNIAGSFVGANGWTVDAANTSLTLDPRRTSAPQPGVTFADKLVLSLTNAGSVLDKNTASLGSLNFRVAVAYNDTVTPVSLDSLALLSGSTSYAGCIGTQIAGGRFALIKQCGNDVLTQFMNGNTSGLVAQPVTPNPVHGSTVTVNYANRGASELTITVYDMLGNEVLRPVDHAFHGAGSWQASFDVSRLPSGSYTFRITDDRHSVSKPFIIQR